MLEKREDDDRFKTWGALLIGLLVSVLGFFGYKSFKDLKNHCEEIARAAAETIANSTAKQKAETTASKTVNDYLQNNLGEKINEAMTSYYNGEAINVMKQRIVDELRHIIDEEIEAKIRESQENLNNNTQGEHPEGDSYTNLNQDPLF